MLVRIRSASFSALFNTAVAARGGRVSIFARKAPTNADHPRSASASDTSSPFIRAVSISVLSACALVRRVFSDARSPASPFSIPLMCFMYPTTHGTISYCPRSFGFGMIPSLASCWTRRGVISSSLAMVSTDAVLMGSNETKPRAKSGTSEILRVRRPAGRAERQGPRPPRLAPSWCMAKRSRSSSKTLDIVCGALTVQGKPSHRRQHHADTTALESIDSS